MDVGLGLVVKLSLGQIQVRSGSVYRSNLILFELDSEVGRLVLSALNVKTL